MMAESHPPHPPPPPPWAVRVADNLQNVEIRNPSRRGDRSAAVLLPLVGRDEPHLLGIVRSDVGRHGGQFALPGGMYEDGDIDDWHTALRETREEVGLDQSVRNLGYLGEFNTYVSRYRVRVHVGFLETTQDWRPQESEVAAILEIPIAELARQHADLPRVDDVWTLPIEAGFEFDPAPHCRVGTIPPRGRGHLLQGPEGTREMPYIWGLTARILYSFLQRVW